MGFEDIKKQLYEYVFSDDDPDKCVERYLQALLIPGQKQLIPLAAAAVAELQDEFCKSDTPQQRAMMMTLLKKLNEKRFQNYKKVADICVEKPEIFLDPEIALEGEAVSSSVNAVLTSVDEEMREHPERWEICCREQNIDFNKYPTFREFSISSPLARNRQYAADHKLDEAAKIIEKRSIPFLDKSKLDSDPLVLSDGTVIRTKEYTEHCSRALEENTPKELQRMFKNWVVSPHYLNWIDPAYRDLAAADLSRLSHEQRAGYLTLMETVRAAARFLEASEGSRNLNDPGLEFGEYYKPILKSARNFLKLTRDSGPEFDSVKAGVYGVMLQLAAPDDTRLERSRRYLTPAIIDQGVKNAVRYETTEKREKASLDDLQDKEPAPPQVPSLWTQNGSTLHSMRVRDTTLDPLEKKNQESLRREFLCLYTKAGQSSSFPEGMEALYQDLINETSAKPVSGERVSGFIHEHAADVRQAWDKKFLRDTMTYQKTFQKRDLCRMVKETDPAFHINSSEFRTLKSEMAAFYEMTSKKGLNLSDEKVKEKVGIQLQKIREASQHWLAKENKKTSRTNDLRYCMVLGILGSIDPAEAEKMSSMNQAPLQLYGNDFSDVQLNRINGDSQTAAEQVTRQIQMLAGTRYSGRTEIEHQKLIAGARGLDIKVQKILRNREQQKEAAGTGSLIQTQEKVSRTHKH